MTNYQKARDWMYFASQELRTALTTFQANDFSACIQHCQQSLERAIKSLLAFLGKEVKWTHTPSLELRRGILENPPRVAETGFEPGPDCTAGGCCDLEFCARRAGNHAPLWVGDNGKDHYT